MSRIAVLGPAAAHTIMIDRDDFEQMMLDGGESVFGKIVIGARVDIDKAVYSVGGSGAAAAVTFARGNHETVYIGSLSRDAAGLSVLSTFDDEDIDTNYVNFVTTPTGCSVILVDAGHSSRTVLDFEGAAKLTADLQPESLAEIEPDFLFATSLNGDCDKLAKFFDEAHKVGAKVMFAPGRPEFAEIDALRSLLSKADIIAMNRKEAATLVPGEGLDELASHLNNFCDIVLITDGIMGAILKTKARTIRIGVYEQARVKDATGAGPAFASGFLAEYAHSNDIEKALTYAAANSTRVVCDYGAINGIIHHDEDLHPFPMEEIKKEEHA